MEEEWVPIKEASSSDIHSSSRGVTGRSVPSSNRGVIGAVRRSARVVASGKGMALVRGVMASTPRASPSIPLMIDKPSEALRIVTALVAHRLVIAVTPGLASHVAKRWRWTLQGPVGISREDYAEFASKENVMVATATENPQVLDVVREAIRERREVETRARASAEEQERLAAELEEELRQEEEAHALAVEERDAAVLP